MSTEVSKVIRTMDTSESREGIIRSLGVLVQAYGLEVPTQTALTFAVDTIQKQFASINPSEILTAAQLAAGGKLNTDARFFGKLNLAILGEILTAYLEHKRSEAAQLLKLAEAPTRDEAKQKAFEAAFPSMVANYKGKLEDVPAEWHDIALRLGILEYTLDDKREAWERGKVMAAQQLEHEAKQTGDVFEVRAIMKKLEQGNQDRAVVMAKKILVYEHLIVTL